MARLKIKDDPTPWKGAATRHHQAFARVFAERGVPFVNTSVRVMLRVMSELKAEGEDGIEDASEDESEGES